MILAIAIGNTTTTLGLIEDRTVIRRSHLPTAFLSTAEEPMVLILGTQAPARIIAIASVVPAATQIVVKLLKKLLPKPLVRIIESKDTPMRARYDDPHELGIDRLLESYAAHMLHPNTPLLVVDFGTATTYNCVSRSGEFLGGAIAPGMGMMLRSLHEETAQLPEVPVMFHKDALGHSTKEAMQMGVMHQAIGGLIHLKSKYEEEAFGGEDASLVITGGSSRYLHEYGFEATYDADLLLKGIGIVAESFLQ